MNFEDELGALVEEFSRECNEQAKRRKEEAKKKMQEIVRMIRIPNQEELRNLARQGKTYMDICDIQTTFEVYDTSDDTSDITSSTSSTGNKTKSRIKLTEKTVINAFVDEWGACLYGIPYGFNVMQKPPYNTVSIRVSWAKE